MSTSLPNWTRRAISVTLSLLAVLTILPLFQNCTRTTLDGSSSAASTEGNGSPYEGKILASEDTCADQSPNLKLKVHNLKSVSLIKNNCAILPQPIEVAAEDLNFASLTYKGHRLFVESNVANKISFVQRSLTYSNSVTSSFTSTAMNATVSQGNLLICSVLYNSSSPSGRVVDLRDNLGNVFRNVVEPLGGSRTAGRAGYTAEVWYAENATGGAGQRATVTFSEAMRSSQSIRCYEYSGIQPTNSIDQVVSTHGGYTGSIELGPIATNWSNELIFVAHWGATQVPNIPGFVSRENLDDGALDMFSTSALQDFRISLPGEGDMAITAITFRGVE